MVQDDVSIMFRACNLSSCIAFIHHGHRKQSGLTTMYINCELKSVRVHLRPPIALEASLPKDRSLIQLTKIFVGRGMHG